jgi:hypothetical protein
MQNGFHQMIRNQKILSIIPVRNKSSSLVSRTHGKYRKQMRREFDDALYIPSEKQM